MRTGVVIAVLLGSVAGVSIAGVAALVWWAGWIAAALVGIAVLIGVGALYGWVVRPRHLRWGATDDEVERELPGDDLVPGARSVTRAITIDAPAEEVWGWLVQIGYQRAGWYSYDWIDNDGVRSADRVMPEFQDLEVGDTILMAPGMGFEVCMLDPPHHVVGLLAAGPTSWFIGLFPTGDSVRLVSRWRPTVERSAGGLATLAIIEPGTFVMERKMLRTIKQRVEASHTERVAT